MRRSAPLFAALFGLAGLIAFLAVPGGADLVRGDAPGGNGHHHPDAGCPTVAYCGNGAIDPGEVCDDGNNVNGDGCASDCRSLESCGNGIVDSAAGEECDDGNLSNNDACLDTCRLNRCGDGFVEFGVEACDNGGINDASCNANCTLPTCGDAITNTAAGEQCDDGNAVNGDGCSTSCTYESAASP
jgi:cysteine-rich repeat protein